MKLQAQLLERSENKCELCQATGNLNLYQVQPQPAADENNSLMVCNTCLDQIEKRTAMNSNHWRCLTSSMWSEVPAIQVLSWRLLNRLNQEDWALDNLDMLYLDESLLAWAKAGADEDQEDAEEVHKDCNGAVLQAGDSVVLIKSLDVKGSSLNAKMGTVVKNIRLVDNNTGQIEGKIEGQVIVILTKYVRKQGS